MHYLAVDHDTRCGHHAVAHNLCDIGDFFEFDFCARLIGGKLDQIGRGLAVFAAGAEYLDVLHDGYLSYKCFGQGLMPEVRRHRLCLADRAFRTARAGRWRTALVR